MIRTECVQLGVTVHVQFRSAADRGGGSPWLDLQGKESFIVWPQTRCGMVPAQLHHALHWCRADLRHGLKVPMLSTTVTGDYLGHP